MKVVVVGEGAREHAIALMISRSSREPKIFSLSSYVNLGLKRVSEGSGGRLVLCDTLSPEKVAEKVAEISPDLIVVGPEEPQFRGVVDSLIDLGYAVFGATKRLSQIEKSKVFMRELMWTYKIPGRLTYKAFTNVDEALEYVSNVGDVVIKPARQAGGKGVKVIADVQAYLRDIRSEVRKGYVRRLSDDIMSHYTDIDYKVLIEERVEGVEYTVMTITDGYYVLPLPLVQDHPHAFEYDIGPETGGMGSIQGPGKLLPFINEDEFRKSVEIIEKSLKALQDVTKERYVGAFSGQMMLTSLYGPTLIEFYSRFGDPEIANLIPTLDTDFLDIIEAAVSRKLASVKLRVGDDTVTVVKAVCPRGYPNNRKAAKGHPVIVDEFKIRGYGCEVLYSGVELVGNTIYTTGSRIAEVLCEGRDFQEVSDRANKCAEAIKCSDGWEVFYRSDIGSNELLRRRISLAELVRNAYSYRVSRNILSTRVDWIPGKGVIYYE